MAAKIHLIENPNYRKCGIKSYVHLIRKYRLHPTKEGPYSISRAIHQTGRPLTSKPIGGKTRFHDVMRKKLSDDQLHEVEIDDFQNDAIFFAPVNIGTPSQTLKLVLDTASPDLWVRSSDLPVNALPQGGGRNYCFDPSQSSSFKDVEDSPWKASYVDGSSVSGSIGADDIVIGGVAIKAQPIQLAKDISSAFTQASADGVLGLGFGAINHIQQDIKALPERLGTGDGLANSTKLFTVKLGSWGVNELRKPFYTFGHVDQDVVRYLNNDLYHTPIDNTRGYWMFESASAVIGEENIDRSENKTVVDTGVELTLLDDKICQAVYDSIPGALYDSDSQGFLIPSGTAVGQLPVIQLAVGKKLFAMPKESLMFAEAKAGYVYGGIQSRGSLEFDILGGTFLSGIYAVGKFLRLK
ncbi:hypothetical protein BBP40_012091 [Aspergillus hancockii]|nr:hypothetical protein BBP40_012091 [Aspergillus hancockii]